MKDSNAIQIAKNLPGVRINIKADLDWIIFIGGIIAVSWKALEYYIASEFMKRNREETEKSEE